MPTAVYQIMPVFYRRLPSCVRFILAAGLLGLASALPAATGAVGEMLTSEEQSAAGLSVLSAPERSALDQLVAVELALARQGDELPGTFSHRRTAAERRSAGLDRLSAAELTRLNELLAVVLDVHPKPKARPRIKNDEIFDPARKPEIHGSISVMVGSGGRGRSFWGSALMLDYFDPATGFALSIGVSNFTGPVYPGYYSPGLLERAGVRLSRFLMKLRSEARDSPTTLSGMGAPSGCGLMDFGKSSPRTP